MTVLRVPDWGFSICADAGTREHYGRPVIHFGPWLVFLDFLKR